MFFSQQMCHIRESSEMLVYTYCRGLCVLLGVILRVLLRLVNYVSRRDVLCCANTLYVFAMTT
jgi:hypothetical protein